jgi:uncharacterized cupredoxin-like copper-binding protein
MTRTHLAIATLVVGSLVVAGALAVPTLAGAARTRPATVDIVIRHSRFEPSSITVPAGVPVTVLIRNEDPIDHEWIVGDAEVHARHRTGTEPYHDARPTEVTIPALESRATVVTFPAASGWTFACHLPGHEAYGMVGTVTMVAG